MRKPRYQVVSRPDEHVCVMPGLFRMWNENLGPGTIIECECGKQYVRGNQNFRWFLHVPKPPVPPKGPGSASVPAVGPWYCCTCGAERSPNPGNACPRVGCNTRSYQSVPPTNPIMPTESRADAGEL